jgi:hypothetical protein
MQSMYVTKPWICKSLNGSEYESKNGWIDHKFQVKLLNYAIYVCNKTMNL